MLTLSFSQIDTYMTCPLKYRFRYIDKIEPEEQAPALAFGSAVHGTIKHYYKRLMDGQKLSPEELGCAFIEDWEIATAVPIRWNGKTPEELKDQGIAMIRAYVESWNGSLVIPVAVEQEITVPVINLETGEKLPDVEIRGFLDRIDPGNVPVELKTASSSWNQWKVDTSLQMTIYSYMLALREKLVSIAGRFEVIVKNKTPKIQCLNTRRKLADFDQMYRTVEQVVNGIKGGVCFPNRGNFYCAGCDYCKECRAW